MQANTYLSWDKLYENDWINFEFVVELMWE